MKKMVFLTVSVVTFLIFVFPFILILPIKMIPSADQPSYDINVKRAIYGKNIVSQDFISQESNLMAIATSIGNPNLKNKKSVILSLYENDNLLRTSILSGLNIEDGDFVKFVFEPITYSKGKSYTFTLASIEAGPEEVLYVFPSESVPDWIGKFEYENEDFDGGLPLVTFHKVENKGNLIKKVFIDLVSRFFGKV